MSDIKADAPDILPAFSEGLLDDGESIGKRLGCEASHVEKLRRCAGLPCIDISIPGPGEKRRGMFRYYWPDVVAWARSLNGGDS